MEQDKIWIGQVGGRLIEVVDVVEATETLPWGERQIRRLIDEGELIGKKVGRIWVVQKHLSQECPLTGSQDDP